MEVDFGDVTKRLMDIADKCCGGRLVSLLEGGYDTEALSRCVDAHVLALIAQSLSMKEEKSIGETEPSRLLRSIFCGRILGKQLLRQ